MDKFLAETGNGTRSQVRDFLKKGLVCVNGVRALRPDQKVEPEHDRVLLQGRELLYSRYAYFMLNKPAGLLSATEDRSQPTVRELIREDRHRELFPVGRLDKDTEGLLILTDDGPLAHRLLSPRHHVDKTYFASVGGQLPADLPERFRRGMDIGDDKPTLPAELIIRREGNPSEVLVVLHEGRYHQIKRMFAAAGCEVLYLKRLAMGGLQLDPGLKPGDYRRLSREEEILLKETR